MAIGNRILGLVLALAVMLPAMQVDARGQGHREPADAIAERRTIPGWNKPLRVPVQKQGVSREEAAKKVKQRYGGKILAVSEAKKDGRAAYRVKGLTGKNQVYVVYVDKRTGRISR